jgi:uncharacterized repeat protein (TIGR01451 family)
MRKQLGLITSLLFLCVTALLWVSCASNHSDHNCWGNGPIYDQDFSWQIDGSDPYGQNFQGPMEEPYPNGQNFQGTLEGSYPYDQNFQGQGPQGASGSFDQGIHVLMDGPGSGGMQGASYATTGNTSYATMDGGVQGFVGGVSYGPMQGGGQGPMDDGFNGSMEGAGYRPIHNGGYGSTADCGYQSLYPESGKGCCESPCRPICPEPCCEQPCRPICPEPCCEQPCRPICPEPCCEQPCNPVCPVTCEPICKPLVRCHYPTCNELNCRDGITVFARNPSFCLLGGQYPLELEVKACEDVCDVVVTAHLPDGVSFVHCVPDAIVEGRRVDWLFGPMARGECRLAKVWLHCECEGEQCACFCATATPVRFCSLLCARPFLTCEKCGPAEVCPGSPVNYTIIVTNRGSCTAEDVVVTDNIPDELEHSSCLRTLTFRLGNLEPCETKKVNICLVAVKRGLACNTSVVTACNADTVSCQCCTNVCLQCIELNKVGPKEQQIGRNADYQIIVSNPGDKVLTDVIVTDCAPSGTTIVAANGAIVNGNQATWRFRELRPGEKVIFTITLTTCVPGCYTNQVDVTNCQGCTACAEVTTHWRGRAALNMCVCDTDDPICIGETTSYCITVVNQGSESDNNVVVTARFPKEIVPMAACGDSCGNVSGQTVTFAPYNNLCPHQTLKYRIDARARESGDARVNFEVSSESIKTPIVVQESTIVN